MDNDSFACRPNADEHCITCSDEAISVRVLLVDREREVARVEVQGKEEEVDIMLIEHVQPGDTLLVHGGVAIACTEEGSGDE
jgi:hydrogenase maturation factor